MKRAVTSRDLSFLRRRGYKVTPLCVKRKTFLVERPLRHDRGIFHLTEAMP